MKRHKFLLPGATTILLLFGASAAVANCYWLGAAERSEQAMPHVRSIIEIFSSDGLFLKVAQDVDGQPGIPKYVAIKVFGEAYTRDYRDFITAVDSAQQFVEGSEIKQIPLSTTTQILLKVGKGACNAAMCVGAIGAIPGGIATLFGGPLGIVMALPPLALAYAGAKTMNRIERYEAIRPYQMSDKDLARLVGDVTEQSRGDDIHFVGLRQNRSRGSLIAAIRQHSPHLRVEVLTRQEFEAVGAGEQRKPDLQLQVTSPLRREYRKTDWKISIPAAREDGTTTRKSESVTLALREPTLEHWGAILKLSQGKGNEIIAGFDRAQRWAKENPAIKVYSLEFWGDIVGFVTVTDINGKRSVMVEQDNFLLASRKQRLEAAITEMLENADTYGAD